MIFLHHELAIKLNYHVKLFVFHFFEDQIKKINNNFNPVSNPIKIDFLDIAMAFGIFNKGKFEYGIILYGNYGLLTSYSIFF